MDAQTVRDWFAFDMHSGTFRWRRKPASGPVSIGSSAGTIDQQGYVRIKLFGKNHKAHRLAWLYHYGVVPGGEIDHINGDRKDNRIENLRVVDRMKNNQNRRSAQRNNRSSGLLGVTFDKSVMKWKAQISVDRKRMNLGHFDDPETAHLAYVYAKRRWHDTCSI